VAGQWQYLYRAIDRDGNLVDVYLSETRDQEAAEALFRWYTGRTFDDKFPPWTGNLVVVRGAQVFAFKPHASGVFPGNVDMERTFPYRTNAHGLRDRDRPAKAQGSKRVLVMGDSYTWGYAVAEEEAYPQVAERLLAERGRPDIEVINGGIPDYNSRQERQLLEQLMPIYQPDAGHPNAEAHRRIAAFLVGKILEEPPFSREPETR